MFGSKPWPRHPNGTTVAERACEGPWAFQPWLVQLQPYGAAQPHHVPGQLAPGASGVPGSAPASAAPSSSSAGSAGSGGSGDPWSRGIIRLQYLSGAPLPPDGLLKEKNWNPFIYKGRLLFSQVSGVGDRGGGAI
jgi:hypothetical protein